MKYWKILLSAIGAGILIGIGGFVYISYANTNKFIAAFLFSLGLFTIIITKLHLFTGKIGYAFENKPSFILELFLTWVGNFIGAAIIGISFRLTRNYDVFSDFLQNITQSKLNDNPFSIFLLSIFCGMMIYIAVSEQKKNIHPLFQLFAIIVPVVVFIIAGFEHVVANMFYFIAGNVINGKTLLYLLLMTLGNSLGSWILWGIEKAIQA